MEIVTLIINAFVLAVAGMAIAFYKTKGVNFATKQDIAGITQKVEEVKAKLQISTKSEMDFKSAQRQTVLNFYDSFIYWYQIVLELSNSNLDEDRIKEIEEYDDKINDAYKKVVIAEWRLELYLSNDDDLLNVANKLLSSGVAIETQTSKFLFTIHSIYENLNELHNAQQSGAKVKSELIKILNENSVNEWNKIYQAKNENDKKVEDIMEEFIKIATKYLKGV